MTTENRAYDEALDHYQAERFDEAEAAFRLALQHEPDRARIHANLARCLAALARTDEAARAAEHALELAPADGYVHMVRVEVLYSADLNEDAIAASERAETAELSPSDRASVLVHAAHAMNSLGRDAEALERAIAAVKLAPDSAGAHGAHAVTLAAQRRLGEAREAIGRAVALAPDDEFIRAREHTIVEGLSTLEGALRDAEASAEAEPNGALRWANVGHLRLLCGMFSSAVEAFDRAIAIAPRDPDLWWSKGTALQRAGRFPEDVIAFRAASQLREEQRTGREQRTQAKSSMKRPER